LTPVIETLWHDSILRFLIATFLSRYFSNVTCTTCSVSCIHTTSNLNWLIDDRTPNLLLLQAQNKKKEAVVRSQLAEQSLAQGSAYEKLKETSKILKRAETGKTGVKYLMGSSQVQYGGEICWKGIMRKRSDVMTT